MIMKLLKKLIHCDIGKRAFYDGWYVIIYLWKPKYLIARFELGDRGDGFKLDKII